MVSDILTLSIAIQGVNNFSSTFRQAKGEVAGLRGSFSALAKGLRAASGSIISIAAIMAQEFVKASSEIAAQFELSMVRVGAIAGAVGAEFDELHSKVVSLGASTMFTAQEVADAAKQLAMAGLNAGEISSALDVTTAVAEVLGLQIDSVAEGMANLGRAFQMNISNLEEFSILGDVLVKTTTSAAVSFEQLMESMRYASAQAAAVGLAVTEVSAAIGILGDMGIKGSKAGTSLNRAIASVILPSVKAVAIIEELGMTFDETTLRSEGLVAVIKELEDAGATASDIMAIFGIRGGRSIQAMVNRGSRELERLTKTLEKSTGSTKKMQKEIQKTAMYTKKQWAAAIETMQREFGDLINRAIVPIMKGLMKLGGFIKQNASAFTALALIVAVLIIRTKILTNAKIASIKATMMEAYASGILTVAKVKLAAATKVLTAAMATNPITAAMIAIIGLTAAIVHLTGSTSVSSTKLKILGEDLDDVNQKLVTSSDILFNVSTGYEKAYTMITKHVSKLQDERDSISKATYAGRLRVSNLNTQISTLKEMVDEQYSYTEGLQVALTRGQEWNKVAEDNVNGFTEMLMVLRGARTEIGKMSIELVKALNEMNATKTILDSLKKQYEDNEKIIDYYNDSIDNLKYKFNDLNKSIEMNKMNVEEWEDVISVNNATISVSEAKVALWESQLKKAEETFYNLGGSVARVQSRMYTLNGTIEKSRDAVSQYNLEVRRNNLQIKKLQVANSLIIDSFSEERAEIQFLQSEIAYLNGLMGDYNDITSTNNIKIRKMRLEARREGRDLTDEELAEIEKLSIENEHYSIKQMEAQKRQRELQRQQAEEQKGLTDKINKAIEDNVSEIELLRTVNENYAMKIQEANLKIIESETEKNRLVRVQEEELTSFLKENYSDIIDKIDEEKKKIEELEDAALGYGVIHSEIVLKLAKQQSDMNEKVRIATKGIWDARNELEMFNLALKDNEIAEAVKNYEKAADAFERISKTLGGTQEGSKAMQAFLNHMKLFGMKTTLTPGIVGIGFSQSYRGETLAIHEALEKAFEERTGLKGDVTTDLFWNLLAHNFTEDEILKIIEEAIMSTGGKKMAAGGIVTKPTIAMIGEAGPEAVVPKGKKLPAGWSSGDSGATYNIEINFYVKELADLERPDKLREVATRVMEVVTVEGRR